MIFDVDVLPITYPTDNMPVSCLYRVFPFFPNNVFLKNNLLSLIMALVAYDPNPLPFLHVFKKEERTFTLGKDMPAIKISQNWGEYGVAAVVWEAALMLGTYLLTLKEELRGKRVLELGSGTGFCGIVGSLLGANVVFTDLKECLHACKANVDLNLNSSKHSFSVKPLNWKDDLTKRWRDKHFDFIIGADLVYIEDTFEDLVKTLKHFSMINKEVTILISGKIRYQERFDKFKGILEKDFKMDFLEFNESINTYIGKVSIKF